MKWLFKEVPQAKELSLVLEKESFDQEVVDLIAYLESYKGRWRDYLTSKR